jgi:hypothetical protein
VHLALSLTNEGAFERQCSPLPDSILEQSPLERAGMTDWLAGGLAGKLPQVYGIFLEVQLAISDSLTRNYGMEATQE